MMKPGKPVHPSNGSDSAPTDGVEISFDQGPNKTSQAMGLVLLTNREAAGGRLLEISFAGGKEGTYFAVPPQTTVEFPVLVFRCRLRGVGGAAAYSIMGVMQ